MEQEKDPLTLIKIELSLDYKLEKKTSISSILPLYIFLSLTLLISIDSPLFYYNMSQYSLINLEQLVR